MEDVNKVTDTVSQPSVDQQVSDEVFVFPTSFAQQRLWFLDKLQPESSAYNVPFTARLEGPLNIDALERTLQELTRRHEILRTTFSEDEQGNPIQVVTVEQTFELPAIDLRAIPHELQEDVVLRRVAEHRLSPFDLRRGPLMRAMILRLSDNEHILSLTLHHAVVDGWSWNILLREIPILYEAFAENKPSPLPELPIQYGDYALWQREWMQGERLQDLLTFWRKQLAGAPASLDLPTDRPRPSIETFHGAKHSIVIPRVLADALKDLSRREGVTFFMTLLAAFNVLLSRYSGQDDIIVGSPMAGRNRVEIEKMIGVFVNTLVLRADLSGNPSFRDLLKRVRETCLSAYAHQELPFEKLVEELKPERDLSRNPIFQVMFMWQNMPETKREIPGLRVLPFPRIESTAAKFDLTLVTSEHADGIRATFEYNTDLFDSTTIERMQQHWRMLLEGIAADADCAICDLPLLTTAQREQLLVGFNNTQKVYRSDICLSQLLEEQAARTPNSIAITFGDERLSYSELNSRANQLAHYLRSQGIGPESLVGVYLDRSFYMLVAVLGVLKAGAAYVPLDPAYPKDRISFIIEDSSLEMLLTQQDLAAQLPRRLAREMCLDTQWGEVAAWPTEAPRSDVDPENLAYVLYTSGSTGKPKGVQIQHRSLVNFLDSMQQEPGFQATDVLVAVTTLSFDIAGLELLLPLTVGGQIVLATREQAIDGLVLARLLQQTNATVMQATPATWRLLLESGWTGSQNLKALCGGEALSCELAQRLLPRCRELWNMYGPTETTIWSSVFRVRDVKWSTAPIGHPIANTQMYVLDRNGNLSPIGVPGELYIGGDGVARGYWNRAELTEQKFITDRFRSQPGSRLYRTGDQVRWLPDGNLQYIGRLDYQVKVRGYRIELGEVETILASHPAVQQSVVMVREDVPGDKRLAAYVVLNAGHTESTSNLRSYLKESLPEYMIPSDFVVLDEFPLTPNGKIDRRALPLPDTARATSGNIPPRDELEAIIVNIWKRVLGVSSVGVTDNFFELGGHSLLAVRLLAEIEKATGKEIPLAALFRGSTVEYLADIVRLQGNVPHQVVLSIQEHGSRPPFFGIVTPGMNALGYVPLARHLGPDQPLYRIQGPGARLRGRSYNKAEFENLASQYIEAMKTVQPQGPYYIGGMCEGARIAFDMARLLEARGEEVGLLAIFDTWVLENSQIRFLWKIDYYWGRLKRLKRLSRGEKWKFVGQWFTKRVRPATQTPQPPGSDWPTTYWPGKNFEPAKFGGRITVFKNPKQAFFYVRDPLMGWGNRTTADVDLQFVETRHGFFMREPYVRDLAHKLSACLRKARTQPSEPKGHPSGAQTPASSLVLSGERMPS